MVWNGGGGARDGELVETVLVGSSVVLAQGTRTKLFLSEGDSITRRELTGQLAAVFVVTSVLPFLAGYGKRQHEL